MESNTCLSQLFQTEIQVDSDLKSLKSFLWEICGTHHCSRTIDKTKSNGQVCTTVVVVGEWENVFCVSAEIAKYLSKHHLIGRHRFSQILPRINEHEEVNVASLQTITPAEIRKEGSSGCEEKKSNTNVRRTKSNDPGILKTFLGKFKKYITTENLLVNSANVLLQKLN